MRDIIAIRIGIGAKELEIDGVLLHSAAGVAKWQKLLAQAQPLLGGFSTGVGIWGSPEVALAGAVAIGFLEAAVTNANQKQGLKLLAEAYAAHERLRPRGVIVPVAQMRGLQHPTTSGWSSIGVVQSELDVRSMGRSEKADVKKRHGATDAEIASGFVIRETEQSLVVLPDSFVTVRAGEAIVQIKWSDVNSYQLIQTT